VAVTVKKKKDRLKIYTMNSLSLLIAG